MARAFPRTHSITCQENMAVRVAPNSRDNARPLPNVSWPGPTEVLTSVA